MAYETDPLILAARRALEASGINLATLNPATLPDSDTAYEMDRDLALAEQHHPEPDYEN